MRAMAIAIGISLAFMALVPLSSYNASAAPESQFLLADGVISSDADIWTYGGTSQANALNPVTRPIVWGVGDGDEDDNQYDGDPGVALWGNATSSTDGSFGTAEIRLTLSDIVGEAADYYIIYMRIYSNIIREFDCATPEDVENAGTTTLSEYLSLRIGFGYVDADTGTSQFINETYSNLSGSSTTPAIWSSGVNQWDEQENEPFDRPFTASEINNLFVIIQMRFDPQAWGYITMTNPPLVTFALCYFHLLVDPAEYTPETQPTGGFVLRPNDDRFVTGYENYSVDGYEDMYGALNETNRHGDADQSYVNASWSKFALLELGYTDPPAWATDVEYKVVFWCIIRQTETGIGTVRELTMGLVPDQREKYRATFYPTTSYTNNTYASDFVPGGSNYWSLLELEGIKTFFALTWEGDDTPTGEFRMTQCAFLVTPVVPSDYVPPGVDYEFDNVLEFLGPGNGFSILFAVIGGIGLIVTAPLMIMFYKDGRESGIEAVALGFCWVTASLGFLIIGTSAWA